GGGLGEIKAGKKKKRLATVVSPGANLWGKKKEDWQQLLAQVKGEINSNTIIVGDFNTPLTPMGRSSKQKINKETLALKDTLDQMDLVDICRTFHPKTTEYTFFSMPMEHSPRLITY
uniref:Endonuclease/exonuclease/phosphatase domain-containing protein n=1 Tax=Equus asinus TaxID=9793 RepID=A0A9L0JZR8_EQUAS